MKKFLLNQTLDSAYSRIDRNLVELKSATIGLCTDIERYFKIAFDVNLNKDIDEESFRRVLHVYPQLGRLTIEQFNRLIILYVNIRGINAHLYLSKPIYIDNDLVDFIKEVMEPAYFIESDRRLTIYGCTVILALLAQKYMIWPFVTSFFRYEFFADIRRGKEMSQFQVDQQKVFNAICGIGKPLNQNAYTVSGVDWIYTNDVLKRTLTLVFFDLEKVLLPQNHTKTKTPNLATMLRTYSQFDEKLIADIVRIRNCWFHGYFLGDFVEDKGEVFEFTFDFACNVLNKLLEASKKNMAKFNLIVNDISYFASHFFNFYVLRIVEVSFKILDANLLTDGKLDSRLDNAQKAFDRFVVIDPSFFEKLSVLLDCDEMRWSVGAAKFLDYSPRSFNTSNLRIIKLHSDIGFIIGECKTNKTDIVLAAVDIKGDKNLVNGFNIQDIETKEIKKYSKFITFEEANL